MTTLQGLAALLTFPLLTRLISENRRVFDWRMSATSLTLQLALALPLLKTPLFHTLFIGLNNLLLDL
jgi:nucleoside permease NupC